MSSRAALAALGFFLLLALAPLTTAEFGPESEDGWPIGLSGVVQRPPVDFAGVLADPLNKAGGFTLYPYYPLLTAEMQRLAMDHPDLVKLTSAGKSTAGLDLWLLEIADFENPDMIPLEEREVVYIDGGTHSNEYSGVYFVTEIAQFLLDEYASNETAKWIVENRHTWIVPMVNTDGSNAFGRLNLKGVNVNRNFPGTWGTVAEDPVMNNPGPAPESEAETRIVTGLMDSLQPDYVNSIHCCGNLWLHPYGAEQLENPADMLMFTRICDEAFAEVRERCGEIWSTIYPASGTTADEGYERVGAASWTYEMSGRSNVAGPWGEPAVNTDVREQERESWGGIMHAFLNVHKYGARPEITSVSGDAGTLTVVVENVGYGNLTAGSVTLESQSLALPFMAPNDTATLSFSGEFVAGDASIGLEWVKRARHMTPGIDVVGLELVAGEDGRLVGVFSSASDAIAPLAVDPLAPVPAPALILVIGTLAVIGVLRRKR